MPMYILTHADNNSGIAQSDAAHNVSNGSKTAASSVFESKFRVFSQSLKEKVGKLYQNCHLSTYRS